MSCAGSRLVTDRDYCNPRAPHARRALITEFGGVTRKVLLYSRLSRVQRGLRGKFVTCERELDNFSDSYTVAVIWKSFPDMEIVMNRSTQRYC